MHLWLRRLRLRLRRRLRRQLLLHGVVMKHSVAVDVEPCVAVDLEPCVAMGAEHCVGIDTAGVARTWMHRIAWTWMHLHHAALGAARVHCIAGGPGPGTAVAGNPSHNM